MQELIEDRIVEIAFMPWQDLPKGLERLGLQVEVHEEGYSYVIINGCIRAGLINSDYTCKAVQIAFAYCGARWAAFLPNLLPKVNRAWKLIHDQKMGPS